MNFFSHAQTAVFQNIILILHLYSMTCAEFQVMHSIKKLFCNVMQICNLVQEFNGLVSKGVNRKIGPFYFQKYS